jgi:hypothetical protein
VPGPQIVIQRQASPADDVSAAAAERDHIRGGPRTAASEYVRRCQRGLVARVAK